MSNSTNQLNQRISNLYGRIGQITSGGGVPTSSGLNQVLANGNTASNAITLNTTGTISSVSAGSISVSSGNYNYIFFTNTAATSTLTATIGSVVDYIIIGGGGGGGTNHAGGGGAGGVVVGSTTLTSTSNIISVGAGGNAGGSGIFGAAMDGGDTTAFGITAGGGGGGGTFVTGSRAGRVGKAINGSGGGGSADNTPPSGAFDGAIGSGSGTKGGNGVMSGSVAGSGGGGGGAGGAGADGQTGQTGAPTQGGVGGAGITSTIIAAFLAVAQGSTIAAAFKTATSTGRIAGGGAGGSWATTNPSAGGSGGGGNGGYGNAVILAQPGIPNTGSGGGGGGSFAGGATNFGAIGGSGIVMVRILTTPTITITDGTLTNVINQRGYSTTNSDQDATHYLNFSDNGNSGVGAIQKTFGIECNPLTNTITATTFNGAITTTAANDDITCYIPFQKSTAGSNLLYVDDNSAFGPLSYNPFTSTLTSSIFSPNSGSASNLSGGSSVTTGGFKYFVFTSGVSNLVVTGGSTAIEYLMVGGGGGGGGTHAGGGGAGGVIVGSTTLNVGSYSISIGGGGAGGTQQVVGTNGTQTTFNIGGGTILTAGGGGGGGGGLATTAANKNGQPGATSNGNGGGGSCVASVQGTAGIGAAPLGFSGGAGVFSTDGINGTGGGGGGAGGAGAAPASGQPASPAKGGAGGNGAGTAINPLIPTFLTSIISAMTGVAGWATATTSGTIAGGGGGGSWGSTTGAAAGGTGGGGNGANGLNYVVAAQIGTPNTGGGGGGGGSGGAAATYIVGAAGGSGIVIIRAPLNVTISTTFSNNNLSFNVPSLTMILKSLPTSNIGLVEGQVWRNLNGSVLNIVPPSGVLNAISATGQLNTLGVNGAGTNEAGAFGLLLLNKYYTGPIIQIKAEEAGTPTDFFASSSTAYGTLQTAGGISLVNFLTAAGVSPVNGGIVTTWYNQTGNLVHATSPGTTASSNIIRYLTASNTLSFGGFFSLPNGAFPSGNSAYSYLFTPLNQIGTSQCIFNGGTNTGGVTFYNNCFGVINDTGTTTKYKNSWGGRYQIVNGGAGFLNGIKIADTYNGGDSNSRTIYLDSVSQGLTSGPVALFNQVRIQNNTNNSIGQASIVNSFNYTGELKYFIWSPSQLSLSDINILQSVSF